MVPCTRYMNWGCSLYLINQVDVSLYQTMHELHGSLYPIHELGLFPVPYKSGGCFPVPDDAWMVPFTRYMNWGCSLYLIYNADVSLYLIYHVDVSLY